MFKDVLVHEGISHEVQILPLQGVDYTQSFNDLLVLDKNGSPLFTLQADQYKGKGKFLTNHGEMELLGMQKEKWVEALDVILKDVVLSGREDDGIVKTLESLHDWIKAQPPYF